MSSFFMGEKGWKAMPVANAVSGNYCQPRCDEPWVEVSDDR